MFPLITTERFFSPLNFFGLSVCMTALTGADTFMKTCEYVVFCPVQVLYVAICLVGVRQHNIK